MPDVPPFHVKKLAESLDAGDYYIALLQRFDQLPLYLPVMLHHQMVKRELRHKMNRRVLIG